MSLFVDGLTESIRTIVAHLRDGEPRYEMKFERILQFVMEDGDLYRARLGIRQWPSTTEIPSRLRNSRSSPTGDTTVNFMGPIGDNIHVDEIHVKEEGGSAPVTAINTLHFPSAISTTWEYRRLQEEQEQFTLLKTRKDGSKNVFPRGVAEDMRTQVGRIDKKEIICYGCYVVGDHILPRCTIPITPWNAVITNFKG